MKKNVTNEATIAAMQSQIDELTRLLTKKTKTKKTKVKKEEVVNPKDIKVIDYSDKAYAVINHGKTNGTKAHIPTLRASGAKYCTRLTFEGKTVTGWVVSKRRFASMDEFIKALA